MTPCSALRFNEAFGILGLAAKDLGSRALGFRGILCKVQGTGL